jgi:Xaa-Pro aminopeptidase
LHRTAIVAPPVVARVEATGIYDTIRSYGPDGILPDLSSAFRGARPGRVALNTSRHLAMADGLTAGMRDMLAEIAGPVLARQFVSSEPIVLSMLGRKFPDEIAAIERASLVTQTVLSEVLSPAVVGSGTTAGAIADAIDERVTSRGMEVAFSTIRVGGRSPAGASRGEPVGRGDVLTIDCGVVHQGYHSDIQRTAYVLRNGESSAPGDIQAMWDVTLKAQEAATKALRPHSTGLAVDTAARKVVRAGGFEEFPHATGHSLGQRVHDIGPMLGPEWPGYGSLVYVRIECGQVFAVEPMVYAPVASQGGTVRMGLEENVVIEPSGARIFGLPQRQLLLIR